jgi:hypothetical protein
VEEIPTLDALGRTFGYETPCWADGRLPELAVDTFVRKCVGDVKQSL